MNSAKLFNIAHGVYRAHLAPLGVTVTVKPYDDGVMIEASDRDENFLEHLCLKGMPEPVQDEYVHCRVHALAAKLIARRYPT